MVNRPGVPIQNPDHTATYADEAIKNFPELKELLKKPKVYLRNNSKKTMSHGKKNIAKSKKERQKRLLNTL